MFIGKAVAYGKKREYQRAEKLLIKAIKFWPQNITANLELAKLYRKQNKYDKADACLWNALSYRPTSIKILWAYADSAFQRGLWKISITRLDNLIYVMEKSNDYLIKYPKMWLRANKSIFVALFRMKNGDELIKRRIKMFDKLNNNNHLLELISKIENISTQPISIKSEMFAAGMGGFYTCKHHVYTECGEENLFVEKCLEKKSKEHLVYNIINENGLFISTLYAKVPQLIHQEQHNYYIRLFLEYIKGDSKSISQVNFFQFGVALGEIANEFSNIPSNECFQSKAPRAFDLRKAELYLKEINCNNTTEILKTLDDYNRNIEVFILELERLPKVFSHNDAGPNNVIHKKHHCGEEFYFIDWESASYNYVGSDVGREMSIYKENLTEEKLFEIEKKKKKGYHYSISNIYNKITFEDILLSSNLYFINYVGKIAMINRDLILFNVICNKINYTISLV